MDIEAVPKKKSIGRPRGKRLKKSKVVFMQVRLLPKTKTNILRLSREAGMSINTYMKVLIESAIEGKIVVRSFATTVGGNE